MKKILSILTLIIIIQQFTLAQNYQTVYSNEVSTFETINHNHIGGLYRFMRIDSVCYETDSVFFPFRNVAYTFSEYPCVNPYTASWLGAKIIIKPNGDNIFFNENNDSIILKTSAQLNESWTSLYIQDSIYVIGKVTMHDTLSFLGFTDSVKTISFSIFDNNSQPIDNLINDLEIKISKNYGFVKTTNLYSFPSFHSIRINYLSGLQTHNTGILNLTWFDIFDFQMGDEIHVKTNSSTIDNDYNETIVIKEKFKYLERDNYPDSIIYTVISKKSYEKKHNGIIEEHYFIHDTISQKIEPNIYYDFLPGEPIFIGQDYLSTSYMYKLDYASSIVAKKEPLSPPEWTYSNDTCYFEIFLDGLYEHYLKSLGGPYYCNTYNPYNQTCRKLVYYKKGGETWGEPLVISNISNEKRSEKFSIYPNPTKNHITISAETPQTLTVEIFELTGKLVSSRKIQTNEEFNISTLSRGVYIIKVTDEERNSFTNKLIKQ